VTLRYTYWNDGDFLIGFLDDFPGWWTQGKDIKELEFMLLDLYDLCDDEECLKSAKEPYKDAGMPPGVLHGIVKIPLVQNAVEKAAV
jgi:predicted RNase H-like HicB family nuclease